MFTVDEISRLLELKNNELAQRLQKNIIKANLIINNFPFEKGEDFNFQLIHIATIKNNSKAIKTLLKYGADKNAKTKMGNTSLHLAAKLGFINCAKILLDNKCEINITNELIETPLVVSIKSNSVDITRFLLDKSANIDIFDSSGMTPLVIASSLGNIQALRLILNTKKTTLDSFDAVGWNSLHYACRNKHFEIVKELLEKGAKIDEITIDYYEAIHIAVQQEWMSGIKILIKYGADPNAIHEKQWTCLHFAVETGNREITEYLLKKHADPNLKSTVGQTPLHVASQHGHLACIELLNLYEAKLNEQDHSGVTPLMYCVREEHLECTKYLIFQGASVNITDYDGWSLVHYAANIPNFEFIEYLIETQKMPVNGSTRTKLMPIHLASKIGNIQVLTLLLENSADINARNNSGWSPVCFACDAGKIDAIKFLISKGADYQNFKTANDDTLIHIAATSGKIDILDYFIKLKIPIDQKNSTQSTPLHLAIIHHHFDVANILISNGAQINHQDINGNTCLHLIVNHFKEFTLYQGNEMKNLLKRNILNQKTNEDDFLTNEETENEMQFKINRLSDSINWKHFRKSIRNIQIPSVSVENTNEKKEQENPIKNQSQEENFKTNQISFIYFLRSVGADCSIQNKESKRPIDLAESLGKYSLIFHLDPELDYIFSDGFEFLPKEMNRLQIILNECIQKVTEEKGGKSLESNNSNQNLNENPNQNENLNENQNQNQNENSNENLNLNQNQNENLNENQYQYQKGILMDQILLSLHLIQDILRNPENEKIFDSDYYNLFYASLKKMRDKDKFPFIPFKKILLSLGMKMNFFYFYHIFSTTIFQDLITEENAQDLKTDLVIVNKTKNTKLLETSRIFWFDSNPMNESLVSDLDHISKIVDVKFFSSESQIEELEKSIKKYVVLPEFYLSTRIICNNTSSKTIVPLIREKWKSPIPIFIYCAKIEVAFKLILTNNYTNIWASNLSYFIEKFLMMNLNKKDSLLLPKKREKAILKNITKLQKEIEVKCLQQNLLHQLHFKNSIDIILQQRFKSQFHGILFLLLEIEETLYHLNSKIDQLVKNEITLSNIYAFSMHLFNLTYENSSNLSLDQFLSLFNPFPAKGRTILCLSSNTKSIAQISASVKNTGVKIIFPETKVHFKKKKSNQESNQKSNQNFLQKNVIDYSKVYAFIQKFIHDFIGKSGFEVRIICGYKQAVKLLDFLRSFHHNFPILIYCSHHHKTQSLELIKRFQGVWMTTKTQDALRFARFSD
ncbi:c2 domain containing protein [Anaeramoeba ignava]|uniref:C2 domain containing protein n=1 Tax=Anaeramoeba ignava TaxID=1746090 RepID=A0A9Q0LPF6_ANAIG|nr:c2 domain containing protein [Anaeramoeba ignava]